MLKPVLTRLLNHLLTQNSWARSLLHPFGGKNARFIIQPLSATVAVLEDGGLAIAGEAAITDATITISLPVALRILSGDETAGAQAVIEGDTEFATALSRILQGMSWEYEEDLSHIVGDVPAHEIAKFGRNAVEQVRKKSISVAGMFAEYWQEEMPLIAKKRHINQFLQNVDILHEDTERLEKRIQKLQSRSSATNS
ncbi:SCP2 sterol-binding domain-containing protein [Methylobacillus gramineus]|uniref:ubiquinone biosynthesis accessory factor UbiJ n=1 Tax=Methylobacillus gramineus TaxID=755169 RepID=UPI001CFF6C3E|nr:SCP2 sterol-binding domain-containing protein [Methylobacillus gramineus]MCB5184973.1 SCP2 sterol-binding domain-containing protein [Methylobacillus gramineus]